MINKKGDYDGKGVAILLLLIALFMVLYMLLLPPEQRDELLNESIGNGISEDDISTKVLLKESPEDVYPTMESSILHEINPINLFIKSKPVTNLLIDTLEVKRTLFSNKPQRLTFDVEDLTNLEDILLFFTVEESKGDLIVELNDMLVFDGKTQDVETIKLPLNYIEKNNVLDIRAGSPGLLFWSSNFHAINDLSIKETYQLTNPKEERIFSMPKYEQDNLKNAVLTYQYYCNALNKDITNLKILLNNHIILDKTIRCTGGSESIEIDRQFFKEGNNKIEFTVGDGDFQFSKIRLDTELGKSVFPTYHFDIKDSDFDYVEADMADVIFNLDLRDGNRKKARIIVNNKELIMDTEENSYSKDISSYVEEGDNLIKIVPQSAFYISDLEIKFQES